MPETLEVTVTEPEPITVKGNVTSLVVTPETTPLIVSNDELELLVSVQQPAPVIVKADEFDISVTVDSQPAPIVLQSGVGLPGATGPQGPAGATGATGPQGPTGATGPQGNAGPQGPTGAQGGQGPTGATGAQGPAGSAATVSVGTTTTGTPGSNAQVINTGSSSAAVLAFQIPAGVPGSTGSQGPQGPVGPASTVPGPQGPQGATGPAGAPGAQGPAGVPGPTGADGESVISHCADTVPPSVGQSVTVTCYDPIDWMMVGLDVAAGNQAGGALVGRFSVSALDYPSRTAVLQRTS